MKRILALLCSVVLLTAFSGCGISRNANQTINVRLSAEPATLDPQVAQGSDAATVISALYEGLCRLDPNGKAIPGAAQSWTANPEKTEFTFHLRQGAVWNGSVDELTGGKKGKASATPVTAEDFVFAWRRALQPATESAVCIAMMCIQNAPQVHAGTLPPEQLGVTAKDARTLVVRLRYACPEFPELTAQSVFMPCNERFFQYAAGRYGMERATTLGNGPFIIPNYGWNHDVSLTVKRTGTYVGQSTALPASIVFLMGGVSLSSSAGQPGASSETPQGSAPVDAANADTLIQAVSSGKLDVSLLDSNAVSAAQKAGLQVTSFQDTTVGLCFQTSGAFQSANLRRAFVQVLNRSNLMKLLPAGLQEATDLLPPDIQFGGKAYRSQAGSGGYLRQNPAAAAGRSLLQKNNKITLLCTEDTKPLASEMLASWNRAFQTYFSLETVEEPELRARVTAGNYEVAIYPYTPLSSDAYTALSSFESGQSGNFVHLKDPAYDALLANAQSAGDLARAEKYLQNNAVFYPLYRSGHSYVAQHGLTGVLYRPFSGGLDFFSAGKEN